MDTEHFGTVEVEGARCEYATKLRWQRWGGANGGKRELQIR